MGGGRTTVLFLALWFGAVNTAQAALICDVSGRWTIHQSDSSVVEAEIVKKDPGSNNSELIGVARFGHEIGRVTSGFIHNANIVLIIQFGHQGKHDGIVDLTDRGRLSGTMVDLTTAIQVGWATDEFFRCRRK